MTNDKYQSFCFQSVDQSNYFQCFFTASSINPVCGWLMVIPWCVSLSWCRGWFFRYLGYRLITKDIFLSFCAHDDNDKGSYQRNEQTFSQRCWPEPVACFTLLVLYTSRQSQILVTTFIRSGPWSLSDNSLPQLKSHKTMTVYSFYLIFSCSWSVAVDISRSRSWQDDMMQVMLSLLLHL